MKVLTLNLFRFVVKNERRALWFFFHYVETSLNIYNDLDIWVDPLGLEFILVNGQRMHAELFNGEYYARPKNLAEAAGHIYRKK